MVDGIVSLPVRCALSKRGIVNDPRAPVGLGLASTLSLKEALWQPQSQGNTYPQQQAQLRLTSLPSQTIIVISIILTLGLA